VATKVSFRCLSLIALATASAIFARSEAEAKAPRPLVIAHRGGAALMPENTYPAFDNAVQLGVDLLEFDMQMTADDQLVISHDGTVNPTFCTADPGSGVEPAPVRELTLAQLEKFDCGSKHREIYPNQTAVPGARMPIPDAFFRKYKNTRVKFYGETKMPGPGEGNVDPVLFAKKVAAVVHKYRLEDRFILQSSDYRTLDAMHALNPQIRTCLLTPWLAKTDYLELARQHHASCMLLRTELTNAAQVKQLKEAGILVVSEVVDTPRQWCDYLKMGFGALFTNDPAALLKFLRGRR
jgi:glycerophosphoryl diester phosphodiesterase